MARGRTPVKDTYSTHDVAKICCVTPTTVIRWIEDGLIPAFKTVGGHRRVRREDLERVCRERGIPFNVPTGAEVGRILVIDDEPVVLDLVRDVVKELNHKFDVEVAKDAFDAGRLVVAVVECTDMARGPGWAPGLYEKLVSRLHPALEAPLRPAGPPPRTMRS